MKKSMLWVACVGLFANASLLMAEPVSKVTDVWVVFKTHFDLGFTDRAEEVFKKYRETMMDGALNVIEQSRSQPKEKQFAWTVAGWPLEAQILGPLQEPARRKRIEQALKEGTLAVHALPFTTHTESLDCEDLVRGLGYASRVARRYGHPLPVAAKMTDVPSHSWIMPTLLKHAGVKFLHIGCNAASQYPRVPPIFWWEGPDGSRILCGYTIDYGSGIRPPKDWPAKNYLAMIMTGDNHGPPSPSEVEAILKDAEKNLPGINLHFGTLDDFANALEKENPELPIVRGDTPDTWIHGLMSMPQTSQIARNIRPLEPALETLDTQLTFWGLKTDALAQPLAEAYENSLLYGEHTWGMNAEYGPRTVYGDEWKKWLADAGTDPAKKKWLQSYEDHRDYIRKAAAIVNRELTARLDLLAKNVKSDGTGVVVFNALPWKRSGVVAVPGKPGVVVFTGDVPANGYKVVSVAEAKPDKPVRESAPNVRETSFFKVTFDLRRGGIASLIDKKSGRELVDTTSPYAVGQFLHERFSTKEVFGRFFSKYSRIQDSWGLNDIGKPGMPDAEKSPYLAVTPDNWKLDAAHGDAADTVTLTGCDTKGLAKAYTVRFTFNRFEAHVEVEWAVDAKTPDKTPEGGWLCFPFAVADPLFTVGRLGGPVNPATDIVSGANRHLMAVTSGVAMTSPDKSGMALCPIDSPLVSLDRPGLWWWTLDFVPKRSTVFVNLYNNMWNTNFPLWQEGSWSSRVRFWPLRNGNVAENLAVKAWEARLPLLAVADGKGGTLPKERAGLTLSRKGVLVTAFGADPDRVNNGTLLRMWEQAGVSGACKVTLPEGMRVASAQPVDLRGTPFGEKIRVKKNAFNVDIKAFAPLSFVLE